MNDLVIREATLSDAEDILKINIDSWRKTYNNIFPQDFLDNLDNNYEESLNKIKSKIEERKSIVAELNGEILGFCNCGISRNNNYPDCGEIYSLYIKNEFKNKGIGTKLFKYALDNLRKTYSKNIVSCLKENTSNIFYKKIGCRKIDELEFILNDVTYKENVYEI